MMSTRRIARGGRPNRGPRKVINARVPEELVDLIDERADDLPRGDILWEALAIYLERPDLGPASRPMARKDPADPQQEQLTMPAA